MTGLRARWDRLDASDKQSLFVGGGLWLALHIAALAILALGLPGRRKALAGTRLWRERWGAWADGVAGALWSASSEGYDDIPDPPDCNGDAE